MDLKFVALIILSLVSIFFIYHFLIGVEDIPSNYNEFIKELNTAEKVFIIADLRNASEEAKVPIMQCGVDIVGSIALASKNISFFVLEDETCISEKATMHTSSCIGLSKSGTIFHIIEGDRPTFYKNRMIIGIRNYSVPCSISIKK